MIVSTAVARIRLILCMVKDCQARITDFHGCQLEQNRDWGTRGAPQGSSPSASRRNSTSALKRDQVRQMRPAPFGVARRVKAPLMQRQVVVAALPWIVTTGWWRGWGSNPRPPGYEPGELPLLYPRCVRAATPALSPLSESNRRPFPYHGNALPTELRGRVPFGGGDKGDRTPDPLLAKQVLYQLSYIPWFERV